MKFHKQLECALLDLLLVLQPENLLPRCHTASSMQSGRGQKVRAQVLFGPPNLKYVPTPTYIVLKFYSQV